MCRMSWNLGASTSFKPQSLSRPVMGLLYFYLSVYILSQVTEHNLQFIHPLQKHCPIYHSNFPLFQSNIWNVPQYNVAWDSSVVQSKPEGNADRTRNVYCQPGKCLEGSIMRSGLFEVNWSPSISCCSYVQWHVVQYKLIIKCIATLTAVNRPISKATPTSWSPPSVKYIGGLKGVLLFTLAIFRA